MPVEDDPFGEDSQYTQSLLGRIKTEEEEARQVSRTGAAERFRSIGPRRRVMAGARQVVGGMPIIRSIPGIREFATPPGGTEERQDLEEFRTGMPFTAGVGSTIGGAAPFMGLSMALPRILASPTASAFTMGGVGGVSGALENQNPVLGAATGAASGALGGFLGSTPTKLITPRTAFRSGRARAEEASRLARETDRLTDEARRANVEALRGIARGGGTSDDLVRQHRRSSQRLQEGLRDVAEPPIRVPEVANPELRQTLLGGLVGGVGSSLLGGHPGVGAVAGAYVLPAANRWLRRRANETIAEFNERFGKSKAFRRAGVEYRKWLNNQVLSDQERSFINATLGSGIASQVPQGRSPVPNISEFPLAPGAGER